MRRSVPATDAIDAIETAMLGLIIEPGSRPVTAPAPNWEALEAAAERARLTGADPERLTPDWQSARPTRGSADPSSEATQESE